jgi:murein DD-endopeptidase MepM/ murein hydrolase activator NlpD
LSTQPDPAGRRPRRRAAAVPAALFGVAALALGCLAVLPSAQLDQVLITTASVPSALVPEPAPVRAAPAAQRAAVAAPKPPAKAKAKAKAKAAPRPTAKRASRSTRTVALGPGYSCPVAGPNSFTNDWGDARAGHRHQGTDILAPYGSRLVAVTSGVVKTAYSSSGGVSLYLRGNDGNEYFYAHNSRNVVSSGQRVARGQLVGYVGTSGNARGGPAHVHFERHPGGGAAVNPYPFLRSICG